MVDSEQQGVSQAKDQSGPQARAVPVGLLAGLAERVAGGAAQPGMADCVPGTVRVDGRGPERDCLLTLSRYVARNIPDRRLQTSHSDNWANHAGPAGLVSG